MSFGVDVRNSVSIGIAGIVSTSAKSQGTLEFSILSATVSEDGTTLTLVFNENVHIGVGGNGGFSLSASGGAATLTYAGGGI